MKIKRLAAFLLALMLIVGLLTVSVSAATYDLGQKYCKVSGCNEPLITAIGPWYTIGDSGRVEGCSYKTGTHVHVKQQRNVNEICMDGHVNSINPQYRYNICPYDPSLR